MIKFGLLTAILDGWTYEQAVDIAAEMGFCCLEVACWPAGKAERRYAGVSHIDAERVLEEYVLVFIRTVGKSVHPILVKLKRKAPACSRADRLRPN